MAYFVCSVESIWAIWCCGYFAIFGGGVLVEDWRMYSLIELKEPKRMTEAC